MNVLSKFRREDQPIPKESSPTRMLTRFFDGDTEVAYLRWRTDSRFVEVIEIRVHQEYRRAGIASAVYDLLRSETGLNLKWIRNAFASLEMKKLVEKYLITKNHVESDDGNTVVLKSIHRNDASE